MKYPVRLTGKTNWVSASGEVTLGDPILKATFVSKDRITLDFQSRGWNYGVSLRRIKGSRFGGMFLASSGITKGEGPVSCTLYSNDVGHVLIGTWREDGYDWDWWAELTTAEEKRTQAKKRGRAS
jgi:hypothetical protein